MTADLKKKGWLALGAWYQTFATANQKASDAVALKPVVSGQSFGDVGVSDTLKSVISAYQAQTKNSDYTPPLGAQPSKETQEATDSEDSSSKFVSIMGNPLRRFTNDIATMNIGNDQVNSAQMNPLLKMKAIGDYTLVTSEMVFTAFSAAEIAAKAVGKNIYLRLLSGDTVSILPIIMEIIAPLVLFTCLVLLGIAFSLSVYLPMIPFIYWLSAAANWITSVLIGVTAGSLWAATHIGTEEEKGGRSAYGYIFLIDAQIRPMLMVLGFAFASLVTVAIGTLLNMLFAPVLLNVQANSMTGIVSLIGFLMVYARLCTHTVTRVFSLQVTLPDYVISWLGGRESNIFGDAVGATKELFAGFSAGLQRAPGLKDLKLNRYKKDDGIK